MAGNGQTVKRVLIVGSRGQDGRLLRGLLDGAGYEVHGLIRPGLAICQPGEISRDVLDENETRWVIGELRPDEIYYLAAYHHASESERPAAIELFQRSFAVNVHGLLNVLESVRRVSPSSRILYAASSHVFGEGAPSPQDEQTPLAPSSVYGISKTAGIHACRYYRDHHELFSSVAILYNHESSFRRPEFVSRKIINGALDIKRGKKGRLVLGDLNAEVDWGYAADSVDAMQRILQLEKPGEFIVATGERHSVREFVEIVFELAGLDWTANVQEDSTVPVHRRSTLIGDSGKLRRLTGWTPTVTFREMVTALWNAALQEDTR